MYGGIDHISVIHDINKSYIKQQMVKAMVTLAKSLGSLIIAGGIEKKLSIKS